MLSVSDVVLRYLACLVVECKRWLDSADIGLETRSGILLGQSTSSERC